MRAGHPGILALAAVLIGLLAWLLLSRGGLGGGAGEAAGTPASRPAPQHAARGDAPTSQPAAAETRAPVPGSAAFVLHGTVLCQADVPPTGARVLAYATTAMERPASMATMFEAIERLERTGAGAGPFDRDLGEPVAETAVAGDGSFCFAALRQRHLLLAIEHAYYGLGQPEVVHVGPEQVAAFTLLQPYLGGHVVGRIASFAGAGGERVRLVAEADPLFLMRHPEQFFGMMSRVASSTATDEDGRFEFRAVLPSPDVSLFYRGTAQAAAFGPLAVRPGQTSEVVLHPVAGGALVATVVDAEGGPVARAAVRLVPRAQRGANYTAFAARTAETDASGTCRIESVLPGEYDASAHAAGLVAANRELTIREGAPAEARFVLHGGGTVRGKVVDGAGEPVVGAAVAHLPTFEVPMLGDLTELTGEDLLAKGAESSALRSDATGAFTLSGIDGDDAFAVIACRETAGIGIARGVRAGDAAVVVRLTPPARLVGRVVDGRTGEPVRDFAVSTVVRMAVVVERPTKSREVTGSADGRFALERVPPGKATLVVHAPGYAEHRAAVSIEPAAELDLGTIALQAGCTVRGTVRTAAGEPAAGITVARKLTGMMDNPLLQSMLGNESCISDREGRFEIRGLAPGAVRLKATSALHASGTSERIPLQPGQVVDGVVIALGAGGIVEGVLELADGTTRDGWMVMVTNQQGGSMRSTEVARDGTFRVAAVDPGRYDVQAMQADWMRAVQGEKAELFRPGKAPDIGRLIQAAQEQLVRKRCQVKEGEVTRVVLDGTHLGQDGVDVTVHVTLGEDAMRSGFLEVERLGEGSLAQGVVQAGVARMKLQPGAHRFTVRAGLTMTPVGEPVDATIPAGAAHAVRLRLPGGRVHGTVVDETNGEPLADAVVRIVSARGSETDQVEEIGFAMTDAGGAFSFHGLDDGRYAVFASDAFFQAARENQGARLDGVEVRSGGTVEGLVLRARRAAHALVRVATASDAPQPFALVLAVDGEGKPLGSLPAHSDGDGMAMLGGLPPGEVRILALARGHAPGFSEAREARTGQQTRFDVALRRGPRVWLRVEGKGGEPIHGVRLSARFDDGPWIPISLLQRVDPRSARLDVGHLPPGRVEFRVHHQRAEPFTVVRTLPDAASVELVFTAPE